MNKKAVLYFAVMIVVLGLAIFALFFLQNNNRIKSEKLKISASFYPVYFFSKEIAGDKAEVYNITPAGAEPHDYEPTAQDMAKIESSKMIVLNGGGLEAWSDNVKQTLGNKILIIIAGNDEKSTDPHFWLSPVMVKEMVNKILAGFIQVDPANKEYYQTNARDLILNLEKLDNEYKQGLADCKTKSIITSHSAFSYLASSYGLKQVPVAGLSPDEEPSVQQLANVAKFAKENNVKYIFFESLVSPKLSQTIADEVGAKTLVLNPLEGLTNEEILQGKDYFSEMENNLTNLKTALECQ